MISHWPFNSLGPGKASSRQVSHGKIRQLTLSTSRTHRKSLSYRLFNIPIPLACDDDRNASVNGHKHQRRPAAEFRKVTIEQQVELQSFFPPFIVPHSVTRCRWAWNYSRSFPSGIPIMGGSSGYQLPREYFVMQRMKIVCLLPLYLCTEPKGTYF